MDVSDFVPKACSTINRKKGESRKRSSSSSFEAENSLHICCETSSSCRSRHRDITGFPAQAFCNFDEHGHLTRTSLHSTAPKVKRIPSKYFHPNFSNSGSHITSFDESSISESDLLQTTRHISTPADTLHLQGSLAQISDDFVNKHISLDSSDNYFKKAISNGHIGNFTPTEATSILTFDELSWRQEKSISGKVEVFSEFDITDNESVTDVPSSLDENSFGLLENESLENYKKINISQLKNVFSNNYEKQSLNLPQLQNISFKSNEQRSLSVSQIQKFLALENTPKSALNKLYKGISKPECLTLDPSSIGKPLSSISFSNNGYCDKENMITTNKKNNYGSSRSLSRPTSALTSFKNDKIPIETTKTDLSWGCVKVGKSVTKEFLIRNKSSKKFCLHLFLCSHEFKIRENSRDSEPLSNIKIILHPHQTKPVIVSFIPTKVGAAVDELYFSSIDPDLQQSKKQCIKLYGYGGSFKLDFLNLTRDNTGRFWLSLGKLDDRAVMTTQFNVMNKGEIPVFIHTSINSPEILKLQVNPLFFVLAPNEEKEVLVNYKPSSEDYKFSQKSLHTTMIMDLGSLHITYGTEVDRGRLRKVCDRCVENGLNVDSIADFLKERIDSEAMPNDLFKFKEPPYQLKEIIKLLNHCQIILTFERDPEQTIIQPNSDDSALYQSLYQDSTIINKIMEQRSCYVVPTTLILTLPYKHKDTIFLKSENERKLNFIVSCEQQGLELKPREGILDSYGTSIIKVKYVSNFKAEKYFKVLVIVENEIFEVEVMVEFLESTKYKKSRLNCMQ